MEIPVLYMETVQFSKATRGAEYTIDTNGNTGDIIKIVKTQNSEG